MQILVTGGAGFVGSSFVRMLLAGSLPGLEGARVTVLDALTYSGTRTNLSGFAEHPDLSFVHGDVRDTGLLDRVLPGHDAIVHVAAESHVDRSVRDASVFVETNVVGTQRLLDAALRHDVRRVLQVSTDEVYGSIDEGAADEQHPLQPGSPYAASKAAGDLLARAYHQTHGLDVRIIRGGNAYGPHQFPEKLIPLFVTNLIDGLDVPLYGDGQHVRDWLHVDDHSRAMALILTRGRPGEVYNVGGGTRLTNRALTDLLLAATGRDEGAIAHAPDRKGHDRRYAVDSGKIERELGFAAEVPFEQGLAHVVDWYREHRAWWEPLKERAAL